MVINTKFIATMGDDAYSLFISPLFSTVGAWTSIYFPVLIILE